MMHAPCFPNVIPFAHESLETDLSECSPEFGEPCFAVLLFTPPKGSRWRPQTIDDVPPRLSFGKRAIGIARYELSDIVANVREWNREELPCARAGKRFTWAVPVSMLCGFDQTARVVDAKGGAL